MEFFLCLSRWCIEGVYTKNARSIQLAQRFSLGVCQQTHEMNRKRNERCGCGSGRKYKACCLRHEQRLTAALTSQNARGDSIELSCLDAHCSQCGKPASQLCSCLCASYCSARCRKEYWQSVHGSLCALQSPDADALSGLLSVPALTNAALACQCLFHTCYSLASSPGAACDSSRALINAQVLVLLTPATIADNVIRYPSISLK